MGRDLAVDQIYDAAFDDGALRELAIELGDNLGARSALIHWIHSDGATDVLAHSGYFTDEQLGLYARDFAGLDPWVGAVAGLGTSNQVHDLESLVPTAAFTASDFYNDYIRAIGDDTGRCVGVRLESRHGSGFIALQRGLGQSRFETENVAKLQRYSGHLLRMLAIRGKLLSAQRRSSELSAMLDAFGRPALLVDASLRVRQANHSAEVLLRGSSTLAFRSGSLLAKDMRANERLRGAVEKALIACEPTAVPIEGLNGERLEVSIVAVPVPQGGRLALLLIGQRSAESSSSRCKRLRALFGLTGAEASLAVALADGMSPVEIADARQTSVGTVRIQIKHIAFKLGCSRQSEIVRIVCGLPALRV